MPRAPYRLPRNLSTDGERAFFETAQGLVGADTNGKADVYMWSGGELSSDLDGQEAARSRSSSTRAHPGDDVFFTTREQLVGCDADDQVDVYDARVGGGIPEQHEAACRASATVPGAIARRGLGCPMPGSAQRGGRSRRSPSARRSRSRSSRAESRRALASGRKAALVVRVNKAGRVSVRGTARIGKQARTVHDRVQAGAGRARKVRLRLASVEGRSRAAGAEPAG